MWQPTRAIGICSERFLIIREAPLVVFLIERDASFSQQRRNVIRRLIHDEVELRIGLVHLVALQQAEASATEQMVLNTNNQKSYEFCQHHFLI